MKKIVLVVCCMLLATMGWANTEMTYDYPITNRYEATVAGTPIIWGFTAPGRCPGLDMSCAFSA